MAKPASVAIEPSSVEFIEEQLRSGRYGSAGEVVEAGLRMLEEAQSKERSLEDALIAGERSGAASPFDGERFLSRMRLKHGG
jgi:antitoxin ParD1/3/4